MKTPWPLAVFFTVFVWAAWPSQAAPLPHPELIQAAQQGKVERLQALLQAGHDPALRDAQGYDALDYAIEWGQFASAQTLLRHTLEQAQSTPALLQASAGVNTRTATCYQTTALMEATRHGDAAILRRLLQAGAQVNEGDRYGDHALNWAVYFGQTEQVQLLVQAGADLTRTGQTDDTPLEIAYRQGHAAIVAYLLSRGAKARHGKPGVPPS